LTDQSSHAIPQENKASLEDLQTLCEFSFVVLYTSENACHFLSTDGVYLIVTIVPQLSLSVLMECTLLLPLSHSYHSQYWWSVPYCYHCPTVITLSTDGVYLIVTIVPQLSISVLMEKPHTPLSHYILSSSLITAGVV